MTAPIPSQTITGTSAADIRSSTPGVAALVETFKSGDTITLNNDADYGIAGDGADVVYVGGTASVSLLNSVVAGYGNDTISFGSASNSLASIGGSIAGNQGADYISTTAIAKTAQLNNAFVGGGLQNDTISFDDISSYNTSTIRGGENSDSIVLAASGVLNNTLVEGNKGADTISVGVTASTNGSVGGGEGQDTIAIGTAALSQVTWVNGGAGLDSIVIGNASLISTLAGGGLADTITFGGAAYEGGKIYGDAVGVTTLGSGSGGTADGNDLIGTTATNINSAASIWGAGGDDTINFAQTDFQLQVFGGNNSDRITIQDSQSATSIFGGDGADTLSLVTADFSATIDGGSGQDSILADAGSAISIFGGAGLDTIVLSNVTGTLIDGGSQADLIRIGNNTALTAFDGTGSINGGDGADTILLTNFASAGSILGGAGNDSIQLIGTGIAINFATGNGTINGGAGVDTIAFQASAAAGADVTTAISAGIASVAYEAGDKIVLNSTAAGGALLNGLITVGNATGVTALSTAIAGSLYAYSDGTDTYFAFGTAAGSAVMFRVTGADLILATATNTEIGINTALFGFTVSGSAATGITLTLS